MRRLLVGAAGLVLITASLAGCSKASATTCAEYGEMTYAERQELLDDLLVEHRLEPADIGNSIGISESVNTFCGMTGIVTDTRPATKNLNRTLDESTDWNSPTW